jgi:hypothetical protein
MMSIDYKIRLQQKLKATTRPNSETECWEWLGQISNSGRGRINIKDQSRSNRLVSAETASYIAFVGKIPEGKLLKQKCGNRLCVNPEHLILFEL